jgi:hypothetical protein
MFKPVQFGQRRQFEHINNTLNYIMFVSQKCSVYFFRAVLSASLALALNIVTSQISLSNFLCGPFSPF